MSFPPETSSGTLEQPENPEPWRPTLAGTVAICTWNRAALLRMTLEQITQLEIPTGFRWELIVVDNNCTDYTDAVLREFQPRLPLVILKESQQGHSHARNAAIRAARGRWLFWTDDDVQLPRDWLTAYVTSLQSQPEAWFFGGPIRPWYESTPPDWVLAHLDQLGVCWALLDHGPQPGVLVPPRYAYGANFVVRTDLLKQMPFDPAYGRIGQQLSSGDDTRLQDALVAAGGWGWWVPQARVDHFLPRARMQSRYAWNILYWMGHRGFEPFAQDTSPRWRGAPRWAWKRYLLAKCRRWFTWKKTSPRWVEAFRTEAKMAGLIRRFQEESRR